MKTGKTRVIAVAGAIALFATPLQAATIAGWDFSQYAGAGLPSTNGTTFTDVLDANYSTFDPTFNAGAESAQFGTMYIDGSNGSTAVPVGTAAQQFVPNPGSLSSNIGAPVAGGDLNPFDSFTILSNEGQTYTNLLGMTATDLVNVVFEADLTSIPQSGSNWTISFAGRTQAGTTDVDVEFSTDGITYDPAGSASLSQADGAFSVALNPAVLDQVFVRLTFDPAPGVDPKIDNVSINALVVPEPGTLLLLGLGLTALIGLRGRA